MAAIEYNKNYYEDRDIKPNEEIFFKLTITPFSSVQSPNLNNEKNYNIIIFFINEIFCKIYGDTIK